MRSIIAATVLAIVSAASTAQADCDTGFNMRTMIVTETDLSSSAKEETFEIVYFICAPGGSVGDPDLGWDMVHLTARDGAEIRTSEASAAALRMLGVAK
jgi:hypothetical protein